MEREKEKKYLDKNIYILKNVAILDKYIKIAVKHNTECIDIPYIFKKCFSF